MAILRPINILDVERRRDGIVERALRQYYSQPVDVDRLTRSIMAILPQGVRYDQIFESVRYLAGHTLDELESIRLAWRLAGNLPALKDGKPVSPWTVQHADEWVPLQILRIQRTRNAKDKLGYSVTSRVMAGTPAPLKVNSFWGVRAVHFVASVLGFSKHWHRYPFTVADELVGLRFFGLIEAARSRGRPEFHEIECPDSLIKWNRESILKLRLRVGLKCPMNFEHECHQCALGYDRCAAATHPQTFTAGYCASCGLAAAPFDPSDPSHHCVHCTTATRTRRRTS